MTLTILLLHSFLQAGMRAPEPLEDLRALARPLDTIDAAANDDSDLAPLAEWIGSARVVAIGESNHLLGSTAALQARLVRYLHEHLGFGVLALEAGVVDCWFADRALADPDVPLDRAADQIYRGGFEAAEETAPLFEHMRASRSSPRPLRLAGFDVDRRPHGARHFLELVGELVTGDEDRALLQSYAARVFGAGNLQSGAPRETDELRRLEERDAVGRLLHALDGQRSAALPPERRAFLRHALETGLLFEEHDHFVGLVLRRGAQDERAKALANRVNSMRDRIMARALTWLVRERFPDERIVVLAATSHLTRRTSTLVPVGGEWTYEGVWLMGDELHRELGDELYTLAVTSYHGRYGWVFPDRPDRLYELAPASAGSLEELAHRTAVGDFLLDLSRLEPAHWLREPRVARLLGTIEASAVWPDVVDAIVFLDEATPRHWRARDL